MSWTFEYGDDYSVMIIDSNKLAITPDHEYPTELDAREACLLDMVEARARLQASIDEQRRHIHRLKRRKS